MKANEVIDNYVERKIAFYNELKCHFSNFKFEIIDSIVINRGLIVSLESEFGEFVNLREKSNNIPRDENEKFKKELVNKFEALKIIFENNDKPSIYWFEILNQSEKKNKELWNKFKRAKSIGAGWWTKPNENADFNSNYLYLGKVEKNLFGRFLQHMGISHKKTSSLKLRKWFKDFEDIDLQFRYIQFDNSILQYLEDLENIFWRDFKPLLGQKPNIK